MNLCLKPRYRSSRLHAKYRREAGPLALATTCQIIPSLGYLSITWCYVIWNKNLSLLDKTKTKLRKKVKFGQSWNVPRKRGQRAPCGTSTGVWSPLDYTIWFSADRKVSEQALKLKSSFDHVEEFDWTVELSNQESVSTKGNIQINLVCCYLN